MEQRYSKLAKNTAIFAIGSFASKVLSFLIVPLYTYVLSTEEYGQIDLFLTTVNFLIPIITLQIQESMIRFLLGREINETTTISNCLIVYSFSLPVAVVSFFVYQNIYNDYLLSLLFSLFVLAYSFNSIFAHYLRAVNKNTAFSVKGIIETIAILSLNVLFLVVFKYGVKGYLLSMLLAQLAGILFLLKSGDLWNKLTIRNRDLVILKRMLLFSIPLIPNSLMWWVMSAGDKYIINWFLGDSANGLYSLSLKIPTIISLLYNIFFQAWQMSAIEEDNSTARKAFYEKIFCVTNAVLLLSSSMIIMTVKTIFQVMDEKFVPAWVYVPVLVFATIFNCQASFLGVVYTTTKNTKNAFFTTALGAVVNLGINLILVSGLGLHGVTIGTCAGYIVVSLVRGKDVKKEIGMSFDFFRTSIALVVVFAQIMITILTNTWLTYVSGVLSFAVLCFMYRIEVTGGFKMVGQILTRKKRRKGIEK